ncbi:MAG: hypothetical protein ACLTDM_15160 [Clostridium butyricum]
MEYNSIVNQSIKREFVEQHVVECQTSMVEYILKTTYDSMEYFNIAPFNCGDIVNEYVDNSDAIEELEQRISELEDERDTIELNTEDEDNEEDEETYKYELERIERELDQLEDEKDSLIYQQEEPKEVYEWWSVDSWLCEKLEEKGEIVIPHMNLWGRCTTGQAILLDGVISRICEDLEILEGQKNDWSKE